MKPESIAFAIAGVVFGLIAGFVIGYQKGTIDTPAPGAAQTRAAPPVGGDAGGGRPRRSQGHRVHSRSPTASLRTPRPASSSATCTSTPNATTTRSAGTPMRSSSMPKDVDVSTDLGVSYYYMNQPDKALAQFDQSLKLDPKHAKTILNVGIVKAFGKQDLEGAQQAWEQVIKLAPNTPEGQAAQRALESLRSAHPPGASQRPGGVMVRFILLFILLTIAARMFWRLVDGIIEGVTGQSRSTPALVRSRRADGARSRLRHLRAAGSRGHARGRPAARLLLLRSLPRHVSRADRVMPTESQLRADIVEVGRRMYDRRYTAANDGNISVRLGTDRLLMTPKGVCKGFMSPDMMCVTDLDGPQARGRSRSVERDADASRGVSPARRTSRPSCMRIRPPRRGLPWPGSRSIAPCWPRC